MRWCDGVDGAGWVDCVMGGMVWRQVCGENRVLVRGANQRNNHQLAAAVVTYAPEELQHLCFR